MEMVLTKLRAKEVDIFITGVSYRVSEDKKSIELMATSTHSVWGDIKWIVGRIKKSFGEVQAFGVGQKGERREYKTIKGVNNFLLKEYRYGITNEKLKELFNSLTDSDLVAEEKNNSINVVNHMKSEIIEEVKEEETMYNKEKLLEDLTTNLFDLSKVKANVYRGKVFIVADAYRGLEKVFKTKRGAKGYIDRMSNYMYYDEATMEMCCSGNGLSVIELSEEEIPTITYEVLYNIALKNMYNIYELGWGISLIKDVEYYGASEEQVQFFTDMVREIEKTRALIKPVEVYTKEELIESINYFNEVIEEERKIKNYTDEEVEILCTEGKWRRVKKLHKRLNEIKLAEKKSIEAIEKKSFVEPVIEKNSDILEKNSIVMVIFNTEKNGIELYFKGKPSDEIRENLKANGFRWARFNKCWYCKDSEEKREFLRKIGWLEVDTEKNSVEALEKISIEVTEKNSIEALEKNSIEALEKNSVELAPEKNSIEVTEKNSIEVTEKNSVEQAPEKNSVEVIEIKNNIGHVVNTSYITEGTRWTIKRYGNFIKCFRIDGKGDPVILHNEQIKLSINLLDFNRLVEDGNIIIPQTNQIEEQATPKAKGVEPEAVTVENKYPEIDINDIEKYTIDKSISDRENNRAFFRSSYINHTEELQEYFLSTNKAVEGIINNPLCTEKIRYSACKYLQSFKEKYYKAYKDYLIVKGNTPSWMETGRGNLNSRRYSKAHDRVDKKLLKVTDLVEKFNNKMKSYRQELNCIKESIERNTLLDILKNTEPVRFKRVKKAINRTSTGNVFNNADFESMVYTSDNNHYIIKLWGSFRLYNGSGEAMYNTGFETLRDAKKYMTHLLSKI